MIGEGSVCALVALLANLTTEVNMDICICGSCLSDGASIQDCQGWWLVKPREEVICFRSPLMRQWAVEVFKDNQVLHRHGREWVITQYGMGSCTLREIIYAQPKR